MKTESSHAEELGVYPERGPFTEVMKWLKERKKSSRRTRTSTS